MCKTFMRITRETTKVRERPKNKEKIFYSRILRSFKDQTPKKNKQLIIILNGWHFLYEHSVFFSDFWLNLMNLWHWKEVYESFISVQVSWLRFSILYHKEGQLIQLHLNFIEKKGCRRASAQLILLLGSICKHRCSKSANYLWSGKISSMVLIPMIFSICYSLPWLMYPSRNNLRWGWELGIRFSIQLGYFPEFFSIIAKCYSSSYAGNKSYPE